MSEDTNDQNQNPNPNPPVDDKDKDLVEKVVKERVEAQLKEIKDKLDGAFKQRDEALRKAAELEQKEKEAIRKQLEEQGKYKELYEQHLAEERAAKAALEKRVTELSRDNSVRDALKSLPFRNDNAFEMAYKQVVDQLSQKDGEWVHKSGIGIKDFIDVFAKDEGNSFLFKAKSSSGAGSGEPSSSSLSNKPKSLFEMTQAEVLAMAAKGQLPGRQR